MVDEITKAFAAHAFYLKPFAAYAFYSMAFVGLFDVTIINVQLFPPSYVILEGGRVTRMSYRPQWHSKNADFRRK